MQRRDFLILASLAPLAARAGTLQCPEPEARRQVVRDGLRAAKNAAKPLLILVAPADEPWVRGRAFGQWLNHGGDAALADVAQCVVIAATTQDVAAELPGLPAHVDPPLWFVWDGVARPLAPTLIHADSDREDPGAADPGIDRNIKALRDALRGALAATRAARLEACPALPKGATVPEIAQRFTPDVVDAAAARAAEVPALIPLLATAARQRVVETRIPGSYWARGSGCGEHLEGVPPSEQRMIKCGMGFVPARSRRFIRFYACKAP